LGAAAGSLTADGGAGLCHVEPVRSQSTAGLLDTLAIKSSREMAARRARIFDRVRIGYRVEHSIRNADGGFGLATSDFVKVCR
jgi:hypothetical protein